MANTNNYKRSNHKNSRINLIYKNKIIKYLKDGGIPVVTGFQGV